MNWKLALELKIAGFTIARELKARGGQGEINLRLKYFLNIDLWAKYFLHFPSKIWVWNPWLNFHIFFKLLKLLKLFTLNAVVAAVVENCNSKYLSSCCWCLSSSLRYWCWWCCWVANWSWVDSSGPLVDYSMAFVGRIRSDCSALKDEWCRLVALTVTWRRLTAELNLMVAMRHGHRNSFCLDRNESSDGNSWWRTYSTDGTDKDDRIGNIPRSMALLVRLVRSATTLPWNYCQLLTFPYSWNPLERLTAWCLHHPPSLALWQSWLMASSSPAFPASRLFWR